MSHGRVRCAMHVHTTTSFDGRWALERVAAALRRRGYGAVFTAEHSQSLDDATWRDYRERCQRLSGPGFTVVPGVEYRDAANVVHLPTWGELPFLGDHLPVPLLLERLSELGGAAVWAHPGRREAHLSFDPDWAHHLAGIEVWNRKYDGWAPRAIALELATQWDLPAIASLDFHRRRQFSSLATWLEPEGPPTEASLVAALIAGHVSAGFLGRPVERWTRGPSRRVLSVADASRRHAARQVRRVTERHTGRPTTSE